MLSKNGNGCCLYVPGNEKQFSVESDTRGASTIYQSIARVCDEKRTVPRPRFIILYSLKMFTIRAKTI